MISLPNMASERLDYVNSHIYSCLYFQPTKARPQTSRTERTASWEVLSSSSACSHSSAESCTPRSRTMTGSSCFCPGPSSSGAPCLWVAIIDVNVLQKRINFLQKYWFFTKILIFYKNIDFLQKYWFFTKILMFYKNINVLQIYSFLTKNIHF